MYWVRDIAFSRTTMANWVIRCSQDWLSLVYDRMRKELLGRKVLHADETPIQVLKGTGKTAANKSYMWVYRTGKDGLPPVVLFEYQPGRSGEYPKKFLERFTRYLHTGRLRRVQQGGAYYPVRMLGASAQKVRGRHAVNIYRSCGNAQFGPSWQGLLRPVVRG